MIKTGQELVQLAQSKKKEHQQLFLQLQQLSHHDVNVLFYSSDEYIFHKINCLDCANCCKTTPALILEKDAKRIAKYLKISISEFYQKYTIKDEDKDIVFKKTPCVFLAENNYCSIYEVRPEACREYPHTRHHKMKQILDITFKNREICPAVFDMVEMMKEDLG
ncbi:MAG: YkgJ family cysteine cluster protein [Chitinophagales bacterium]|nr:YkgJ family cysteine cluster protein [Chitinophagales bacterium]